MIRRRPLLLLFGLMKLPPESVTTALPLVTVNVPETAMLHRSGVIPLPVASVAIGLPLVTIIGAYPKLGVGGLVGTFASTRKALENELSACLQACPPTSCWS